MFLFYHYFVEDTSGDAAETYPWGTSTSLTPGVPGAITFPVTSGKFRLKVDFKLTNTLENINSRLVIK